MGCTGRPLSRCECKYRANLHERDTVLWSQAPSTEPCNWKPQNATESLKWTQTNGVWKTNVRASFQAKCFPTSRSHSASPPACHRDHVNMLLHLVSVWERLLWSPLRHVFLYCHKPVSLNELVHGPFYFLSGAKKGGNCGEFKEFKVVLTPKPLIIAEGWHCVLKTWQSAEMLGRAACNCSRSGRRTMGVCADFWPEQWQDDRDTQSSRICTCCRQETQLCRAPVLPKKHFFIFLFPLSASFMYSSTSGAHHSKPQLQTIQSLSG